MSRQALNRAAVLCGIALGAAVTMLAVRALPGGEPFALRIFDQQLRFMAVAGKADPRIVLVEVDQASLDHFARDNIPFPWPRTLYAPLIDYCTQGGARAILFDVLFDSDSVYGESTDREFAAAIARAGNVFLAASTVPAGVSAERPPALGAPLRFSGTAPASARVAAVALPLERIAAAAAGVGVVSHEPDSDGVYRRIRPAAAIGDSLAPALFAAPSFAGARAAAFDTNGLQLDGLRIPLDGDGAMLINFHGPRGTYRRYSAAAVISSAAMLAAGKVPAVPREAFHDAYVIVGYSARGLFDLKPMPLSPIAPAHEINAAALDNMLNGDFIAPAPTLVTGVAAVLAALAVAAAILLVGPVAGSVLAVAALLALALGAAALMFRSGQVLDLFVVYGAAILAMIGGAGYRYQVEGRQRRFVASAFRRFVSPKIVNQILAHPERLRLGGERRQITVLFADLAGFTPLTERLDAQALVAVLNRYTTELAEAITGHDGTLDKYIGDAVMAFWGAPVAQPGQARLAVGAALESRARVAELAGQLRAEQGIEIAVRIGIDAGECVVGNMGSRERFDYTAIGDAVNQASRLEGLNKQYGTTLLVSETVWNATEGAFVGRVVDQVRVKGKSQAVRVHEPFAPAGRATAEVRELCEDYERAFAAYGARDWDEAERILGRILSLVQDRPSMHLLERVREFRRQPPPGDWDGTWTHTSK